MISAIRSATFMNDALSQSGIRQVRSSWRTWGFQLARAVGLFALTRWLYRNRQMILCYHAFSYEDEHLFRPQLYMHPARFAARLDLLARCGFRVIPLADAVKRIEGGTSRLSDVAITIDDGFSSVHALALPQLRMRKIPATLYLTTYYVEHPFPVVSLALQYVFWKSDRASGNFELGRFGIPEADPVPLRGAEGREAIERILAHIERALDEPARWSVLAHVAQCLDVAVDKLAHDRRFHLVTPAQARELQASGIDLQLHTHRHRFPEGSSLIEREIADNRRLLGMIGIRDARHFCYPSGEWRPDAFSVLAASGIVSATTCRPGLNWQTTHLLALQRFLDADDVSDIEFEAEMTGFKQLLRDLKHRLMGLHR